MSESKTNFLIEDDIVYEQTIKTEQLGTIQSYLATMYDAAKFTDLGVIFYIDNPFGEIFPDKFAEAFPVRARCNGSEWVFTIQLQRIPIIGLKWKADTSPIDPCMTPVLLPPQHKIEELRSNGSWFPDKSAIRWDTFVDLPFLHNLTFVIDASTASSNMLRSTFSWIDRDYGLGHKGSDGQILVFPLPNTFEDGTICMGDNFSKTFVPGRYHTFIEKAFKQFWIGQWNNDLSDTIPWLALDLNMEPIPITTPVNRSSTGIYDRLQDWKNNMIELQPTSNLYRYVR